jgi:hypothetical protein
MGWAQPLIFQSVPIFGPYGLRSTVPAREFSGNGSATSIVSFVVATPRLSLLPGMALLSLTTVFRRLCDGIQLRRHYPALSQAHSDFPAPSSASTLSCPLWRLSFALVPSVAAHLITCIAALEPQDFCARLRHGGHAPESGNDQCGRVLSKADHPSGASDRICAQSISIPWLSGSCCANSIGCTSYILDPA